MRKLFILFLLYGQMLSAQYGSSYNSYGDDNIFKTILIPLLLMVVVFGGVYYLISSFEAKNKSEDYSTRSVNADIWGTLIIYTIIILALVFWLYKENINPYLAVIPAKIIGGTICSHFAKRKNRNSTLWWFLGFLEYHSALIVLALTKGLLKKKKVANEADSIFNERLAKLNEMFKENLITEDEFEKKILEAESEYRKRGYALKQAIELQQKNDIKSKIESAFKDGLLTEEEYNIKMSKFSDTQDKSVEETIEEEKEKFRRLYDQMVINHDEMMTKFKQIEDYHRNKNK